MQNFIVPAAFGRLRVETRQSPAHRRSGGPAAFGRLRVETWLLLSQIRAT